MTFQENSYYFFLERSHYKSKLSLIYTATAVLLVERGGEDNLEKTFS